VPAPDETRLLERLLSDPEFRARFREDPQAAAREAGVELSDELAAGGGMQTLDGRESKSSFAGALMAAAVEGIGLYELGQHVLPGVEDAHAAGPASDQDPDQFGQQGAGGAPTADTLDLLHNKNVILDADAVSDLKAGKVDPRVVSVLEEVAKQHRISISSMVSDHSRLTAGGSVSNHYYGRAVDISMVDGRPVSPGNLAARQVAVALSKLPESIRPSEIGSPWKLPGAAYFSDGDHQDHLHVGFDDPLASGWTPPASSAGAASNAVEPAEPPERAEEEDAQENDAEAASAIVQNAAPPADPDDLEGNLDDEDAGVDEEDGSDEDEADEGGGEDDDGPQMSSADGADGSGEEGEEEDEDEGQDEPGEGSSGEDAADDTDGGGGGSPEDSSGNAGEAPDAGGVPSDYPGDDAPQEKIAAWMAEAAAKRGLPRELPVMAGLTESGLRNLNYGDRDSVGFFQMRTSIWDQGEYAGYGRRPERQLDWFLDQAEAVKQHRIARGLSVTDPNQYGEWIADIERPAEQFRGRYQLRLEQARALLGL
jgi:hypothetical protein